MIARRRRSTLAAAAVLGLAGALALALVACGEEGVTPDCPPLPLYDIHDENWQDDPAVVEARAAAVDAGCLTELGTAEPAD